MNIPAEDTFAQAIADDDYTEALYAPIIDDFAANEAGCRQTDACCCAECMNNN